jgi:hypothetical protein
MAVTESWLTRRYSQPNIGLTGAIWVCGSWASDVPVQGFAYAVIELLDQSQ